MPAFSVCVLSSPVDEDEPPYSPAAYLADFIWEHHILNPAELEAQVTALSRKAFDVYLNLCDGTPDDPVPGIELVQLMEKLNLPFTGAGGRFFDPTRAEMKNAATRVGIPVPGSCFAADSQQVEQAGRTLHFPLIVKPAHGYSSVGLRPESRVETAAALLEQAEITLREFNSLLIEEFIDGREYTALVAENPDNHCQPITFKPVEFLFPPGECFKHYDMKWKDCAKMTCVSCNDPAIETRLRNMTSHLFLVMQGDGYARCDFRVNTAGEIFMIEINPNCGIFYPPDDPGSADFILLNDPLGHKGFLDLIFRAARQRVRNKALSSA